MRSEEAQIGKRVRVKMDSRTGKARAQEGTIAKRWGNPAFTALDVLLDDGDWQLFWHHELEEVDEEGRGARCQNGATLDTSSVPSTGHTWSMLRDSVKRRQGAERKLQAG
jgi:hypothetical protein